MNKNLVEGKVAVVTGSGQGIGEAIARRLAEFGAKVIITDINREKGQATADALCAEGYEASFKYFNVTDFDNLKSEIEAMRDIYGRIDIWVNNAGLTGTLRVDEITIEHWDKMQTIDIKSVFFCTQAVYEIMKEQNYGKLVHISSMAGERGGRSSSCAYSSAKAAVLNMSKCFALSGGQYTRLALARLLATEPDILMLDEPTNHLDIESIQWLEEYLKNYNGAVLLISHDRAFLDNVTTRTIELSLGKIYDYKVPYSQFVTLRAERRAQQLAAYQNQQRLIEKSEEFIEKFRYKPTKSNQVQSRIKQLDKLERIEVEEEDLATLNIKFPPAPRSGQIVADIKGVGKAFGDHRVFSGAEFTIHKGDKIALVGRNGEGKTTFARMLIGELEQSEGEIKIGANVSIGYYAQNQDDLMNGDFTVYDTLDRVAVGDIRTRLRDILGAFLFRGEDVDKKVKELSGGERSRLAMARMMLEPHNLLVLDEQIDGCAVADNTQVQAIFLAGSDLFLIDQKLSLFCGIQIIGNRPERIIFLNHIAFIIFIHRDVIILCIGYHT